MGRAEEARALYTEALAIAREIGDPRGELGALANLANDLLDRGLLADAQDLHERSLAIAREIGDRRSESVVLSNVGPLCLVLGDRVRARQALESSLALVREIGNRYTEGFVLLRLGQLADEEGDPAAAMRLLEESLELRQAIGHGDGIADSLCEIGDLRRRSGDAAAARAALEEARTRFHDLGRESEVGICLALLTCLPGGDPQAAVAALAAVVDDSDVMRARFALWEATRDRAHLVEAKRLLDFLVAHTPPDLRGAVAANVRLHREILAAARAQGL
jgi:tetratricopeptide (TPR) repeat protein